MTTILAVPGPSSTWAAMSPRILPCGVAVIPHARGIG